jgi:DNA-binding NtrC family response regulator
VIALQLPPLRERRQDIPLLLEHFLRRFSEENDRPLRRFSAAALKLLMDYDWPGNVRELENVVERGVVLSTQELLDADLLPEVFRTKAAGPAGLQLAELLPSLASGGRAPLSLFEIVEEIERRVIADMLERTSWNQTEAAERFQIPLSTLNQKIKRLGIETRRRGSTRVSDPIAHITGK